MTIGGFLVAALLAISGGVIAAKALDGTDPTPIESTSLTAVPVTKAVEVTVASRPTTSVESLTTAATTALAPVIEIRPVAASASFVRESVERLRCGGRADFLASYVIDGDPQTGWGASSADGTGQSVRVDLGAKYAISQVGITPGFLRNAPRSDQGCATVSAFRFNRRVTQVKYTFDDGTSIEQRLGETPGFEMLSTTKTSRTVTVTILGTQDWGTDDDTIISDVRFLGRPL